MARPWLTFDALLVMASWVMVAVPALIAMRREADQVSMVLVLATVIPLLALLSRHLILSCRLTKDNRDLADSVFQLQLAEGLAGLGRWSIEVETGRHRWSEELCNMAGLRPGTAPTRQVLADLLTDGWTQMETTLRAHSGDRESFPVEFEIKRPDGECRILRARAQNAFSHEGELEQIFLVVRDVTDDYRQVASIRREKQRALRKAAEAQRLANTDPLTGLANRRHFMSSLDQAILHARKSAGSLALLVFDIDHFKQVNDTHGHQTGDRVLKHVAQLASERIRPGDLLARVGGEEFIWLMPGADTGSATAAAERLRWSIEAQTATSHLPGVTVSVGNAVLQPGDSSLTLFARADAALYEAKRAGRNQVRAAA